MIGEICSKLLCNTCLFQMIKLRWSSNKHMGNTLGCRTAPQRRKRKMAISFLISAMFTNMQIFSLINQVCATKRTQNFISMNSLVSIFLFAYFILRNHRWLTVVLQRSTYEKSSNQPETEIRQHSGLSCVDIQLSANQCHR